MRISTLQIYQQGIDSFGVQQTKLAKLQDQISSGVKLTRPSDDPSASARVLQLEQAIELNVQYNVNVTLAQNRLQTEETALQAVENTYFRLKELAVQANGALNDSTALGSIRDEVEERYQELMFLANTKDASGKFLFAGFQNETEPFTPAVSGSMEYVTFNGDQGQRSFQISETRQITADDSGVKIFMQVPSDVALNTNPDLANTGSGAIAPAMVADTLNYVPGEYQIVFTSPTDYDVIDVNGVQGAPLGTNTAGQIISSGSYTDSLPVEFAGIRTSITGTPAAGDTFTVSQGQYRDIFQTLQAFMYSLGNVAENDVRYDNIDQVQRDMKNFFDNVLEARTSVGGRLSALDTQYDDNLAFITTSKQTVSSLRDTDLAEAISKLTIEQTTLDAAQAVFARISSSSLFNFLR